jgi:hypothetical protein
MRPFWALSKYEVNRIFSKRPEMKRAWADLKQFYPFADKRGLRRAVFIFGWLAATQYYENKLMEIQESLSLAVIKAVERERVKWIRSAKLGEVQVYEGLETTDEN